MGNFEEGEDLCEKALGLAVEINHFYPLGLIELFYAHLLSVKGDGNRIIEHGEKCVRYSEEGQGILILGLAWSSLGGGYYYLGDLETARRHVEKGLKIQKEAGIPVFLSMHYWFLSMVYFELGDLENARSYIEEALKLSEKNNERWMVGASSAFYGRILGKEGPAQSENAEKHIMHGIRILDELRLKPYCSQGYLYLGELYAHVARIEKALDILEEAERMFKEMGMDHWCARAQTLINELQNQR